MDPARESAGEATKSRLIDATMESISANGLADTTTSKISSLAQVSTATIHHYFDNKDNLIQETMLHLLRLIGNEAVRRLGRARSGRERVIAIVESASFAHVDSADSSASAWFAFWAQAEHHPGLGRLLSLYTRRLRSNLHHSLTLMLGEELPGARIDDGRIQRMIDGIVAMVHGTFVSLSIGEGGLTQPSALALIGEYLDMLVSAQRHPQA